ncbi:AbrB/MazE/SpoVT family DNA-binding domain-containing protein [Morganella psychrotolerans]|uniref:AbrB/MazE/SpoVT family DNA-binding domain-containing protein n=1 Tax=Morganella psychrotolerans TaxID=368603 RepID=A0A5M9QY85_9GAMM|nr:AbrB/MazE/SpoVT family DNA-binding domain-containing protein [Morganella psychrotolerans]KAA8713017.1 AbrB/MazE/SpoVT family DNA-binding domain-containing protein [Morganella psychrotolerans]OBU01886.1 antitoxin [Morganella psychrotolerans]
MTTTRLRQQGGAVVLTIPSDIAARLGWVVGKTLDIREAGDSINISPSKRAARGRKSVSWILDGIDENEIQSFNEGMADEMASQPVGNEVI